MQGTAATGRWGKVVWGSATALEFYDNLDQLEKAKSTALFHGLAEEGVAFHSERFKAVTDSGLFEFKPTKQVRFLGDYRGGQRFVVVIGTRKKQRKLDRGDIEQADRLLQDFDESERAN